MKRRLRYHWQFDAWIERSGSLMFFVGSDPIGKQMFFGVE